MRQRLLNIARDRGEDFQIVLTHYAIERLLYRLGRSPHAGRFVLKGGMLFAAWDQAPHRPTRDLDLLGYGGNAVPVVEAALAQIAAVNAEPDGMEFDVRSVRGEEIRHDHEYQGVRVRLLGRLGGARIPVQVDVGFGDVVSPPAYELQYPALLGDLPAPRVRAYPPPVVVAEKFQTMTARGMANTRLKDFYDLWALAGRLRFEGPPLRQAIEATFRHRRTNVPTSTPVAFSAQFAEDPAKRAQWTAFVSRTGLTAPGLPQVISRLQAFLLPPSAAAADDRPFSFAWSPAGPWQPSDDRDWLGYSPGVSSRPERGQRREPDMPGPAAPARAAGPPSRQAGGDEMAQPPEARRRVGPGRRGTKRERPEAKRNQRGASAGRG